MGAVIATAVVGAVGSGVAAAVGGGVVVQALVGLATQGVQLLVGQLFKEDEPRQSASRTLGFVPDLGNRFVTIGNPRVGGHLIFFDVSDGTSGATTDYYYNVWALSYSVTEASVSATVPTTYLNGEQVTLNGSGVVTAPSKWANLVKIAYEYGAQTSANALLTANFSHVGSSHIGQGITMAIVEQQPVKHTQYDVTYPNDRRLYLQADLKGALLPDPNHPYQTWTYSNNAARAVLWHLLDTDAGFGLDYNLIDWKSFQQYAALCDGTVAKVGGTETRYTANGFVDFGRERIDVLRDLLTNCDADLRLNHDGELQIVPWYQPYNWWSSNQAYSLTDSHALLYELHAGPPEQQRYNRVVGLYLSPDYNYEVTPTPPRDLPLGTNEARNTYTLQLPFCTSGTHAQRLTKRWLWRLNPLALGRVTTDLATMHLMPGDWMSLATTDDLVDGPVRIETREIADDAATLNYNILAIDPEYDDWTPSIDELSVSTPPAMNSTGEILSAPTITSTAIVEVQLIGSVGKVIEVTHSTESGDLLVEIGWRINGSGAEWEGPRTRDADVGKIRTGIVPDNETMDVSIRFRNRNGVGATSWTSSLGISTGTGDDSGSPADCSSLSTSGATTSSLTFNFTTPSDAAYFRTLVRYAIVTGSETFAAATDWGYFGVHQTSTAKNITVTGLLDGTQYKFWAQAVNNSGVGSSTPPSATGTTTSSP